MTYWSTWTVGQSRRLCSVGSFLGVGDKLVAVPSNQIKVSPEAKFTAGLTKDQLTNAPAFDPAKMSR
jgi:hypothetical protein